MTIDDVIDVSPGPAPGGRRRRVAVGLVIAVIVAGGGVAAWAATRGDGGTVGAGGTGLALACPAGQPPWGAGNADNRPQLPSRPTASGTDGRLVPTRSPDQVTLCEYDPAGTSSVSVPYAVAPGNDSSPIAVDSPTPPSDTPLTTTIALTRSTDTSSGAAATALVRSLQDATVRPSASADCAVDWVAPPVQYLIGLTYDDGVVWIATPDECAGITNGDSHSDATDIRSAVVDMLDATTTASTSPGMSGTTVTPIPGSESPAPGGGTTGDPGSGATVPGGGTDPTAVPPADPFAACFPTDTSGSSVPATDNTLVPFTPSAVKVCHQTVGPDVPTPTVVDRNADVAVKLADALDGLPTLAPDTMCPDIGGETWRLLFTDGAGVRASVLVDAGGCRTASDGTRVRQADAALFALLRTAG